ncbi:unnamed protein product [Rhizoctonia solani]|uniref:Uncharacterized protein n=1 Tax=Rhizoctonia solani TaxID=456999 RepID=A0A8H3BJG4_9AGAM|nr:unnamed protein product [Rhizoctonia solani]
MRDPPPTTSSRLHFTKTLDILVKMAGVAATNITGTNQSYFFQGDKYVKIKWTPGKTDDTIAYGPTEFVKEWASLKEAGFYQATKSSGVYTEGKNDDELLDGPKPVSVGWSATKFESFDIIFGRPGSENAYCFSGDKYVQIKINVGGCDELVSDQRDIADFWQSLVKAGFY